MTCPWGAHVKASWCWNCFCRVALYWWWDDGGMLAELLRCVHSSWARDGHVGCAAAASGGQSPMVSLTLSHLRLARTALPARTWVRTEYRVLLEYSVSILSSIATSTAGSYCQYCNIATPVLQYRYATGTEYCNMDTIIATAATCIAIVACWLLQYSWRLVFLFFCFFHVIYLFTCTRVLQ